MQAALTTDKLGRVSQLARAITEEVGRAFIGAPAITEALLTALLARGHVLIEGYPGVAKTTLVKAFSQILRETNLRPQLVVAGGQGWLMDETFSAMCDEEIRAHLCLTGYLNDDELRALYSSCRVFIYPSLYEGFGLPPLEAMACGAPVIASRIPALQETLSDAAILIDPLDVGALTRAIIGVLNDDGRKEQIGAGNAHVKRFSWEQAAKLTYEIYSQALK